MDSLKINKGDIIPRKEQSLKIVEGDIIMPKKEQPLKSNSETNYRENIMIHREKALSIKAFDKYYKKYVIQK